MSVLQDPAIVPGRTIYVKKLSHEDNNIKSVSFPFAKFF